MIQRYALVLLEALRTDMPTGQEDVQASVSPSASGTERALHRRQESTNVAENTLVEAHYIEYERVLDALLSQIQT